MRIPIYKVDAFTDQCFGGNPAAVMPLNSFLPDAMLQAIAAENNLSETAFIVPEDREFRIRWFTPLVEVPLCGHATLASSAVVMERLEPQRSMVVFHSASGPLTVTRKAGGYAMDFPARPVEQISSKVELNAALGIEVLEVVANPYCYLALIKSVEMLRELSPNMAALARLDRDGIIVTAAGDGKFDFYSRYFAPAKGIDEDPVTGGAHCSLATYWAGKLGKTSFKAFQCSRRGGQIICELSGDRVILEGNCAFYLQGEVSI